MRHLKVIAIVASAVAACCLAVSTAGPHALAQPAKPAVPAGTDPGGVAVALLGPGLDYTNPLIAPRLARDGEGDPIGRDFAGGDNRPYEPADAAGNRPGTNAALVLVRLVERVRFVAVREHPADPAAIGRMIAFTMQSPATIAVWLDGAPARRDWPILVEAARRFSDRLVIVPAPADGRALAALPRLPNLVLAASAARLANGRAPSGVTIPKDAGDDTATDLAASLWVAGLAARTLVLSPSLDASGLARALAGMSHPQH